MEMNNETRLAWEIVESTGANLFLTGKAGTGKTTFLKELRRQSPKRMVVLAPTGIAAINAGGTTIHSFFQLPLSPFLPGTSFGRGENKFFRFSNAKRDIIRTIDLLVIDEISMVRADLLDAVDSVMRRYRNHNKPFGGAQLLMIGDVQQLAPVVKDDEWAMLSQVYDTPYFFSSKALAMTGYLTVELKTVYRQQDVHFISLLNLIRENKATADTLAELNKRYIPNFKPAPGSDYIILTTHNRPAQAINERELDMLPAKPHLFKAQVQGNFPETSYPADESLTLKAGAQIMFIKNDPMHKFYNGMIGEVVDVDGNNITVRGKDGGTPFRLDLAEWTNAKYTLDENTKEIKESVEGVFRQYPVRLAWAITIHKSQGLTFEHAIIDASNSFAHGQTYVALSRCKSLEGMVLSQPLSPSAIISDSQLDAFSNSVAVNAPTEVQVKALEKTFVVNNIDELFDLSGLKAAVNMVLRTLAEHLSRRHGDLFEAYKRAVQPIDELMAVAQKFKVQYTQLLAGDSNVGVPQIQERIHKGAAYFAKRLNELASLLAKTHVSTDNKVVKKQFDERFAVLNETFKLKQKLLEYESRDDIEFSVGGYLRAKAIFLLGQKPDAKPKPQRQPTKDVSLEMFNRGMTIEQIAAERGLTPNTVFGHLASFVTAGLLPLNRIVSHEHEIEISNYLLAHPDTKKLSEVKEAISDGISYEEIRVVMASMEKEAEQN